MTALDACHWWGAECILLPNTDLGSVYDANASVLGSISTGTDEDEGNDKNVFEDDEDFCTYLNGEAITSEGLKPVF